MNPRWHWIQRPSLVYTRDHHPQRGVPFSPSGTNLMKGIPSYLLSPRSMTVSSSGYCWRSPKHYYISWDNTSYFNSKTLTSQGFKEEFVYPYKVSQWEAGLTELYCIELYMDPGSEDLLCLLHSFLWTSTPSLKTMGAREESCIGQFIYVASVASGMWNFHPYSIN